MNWIDFGEFPTDESVFSKLFLDYIEEYRRVEEYFGGNYRENSSWLRTLQSVTSRSLDRSAIAQILVQQNRNFHCGVRTLANIDALMNDNGVAVVTGQQVGLFTGPLYTIYKTLTTLKLVEKLAATFPDYSFVPVFWLEGEDHDYEEVNSINLISSANELARLEYRPKDRVAGKNLGAVGVLEFDEQIEEFFTAVEVTLPNTEFKEKVLHLFRAAYQRGMTFNKAFVHLMNVLLEDSGLVFLDPHDSEIKKLIAPLFRHDLEQSPRLCQLVIDQSARLEKHYHAQVKPKPVNLFLFWEGGRYLLEPREEGYALKGTRKHLTRQEVHDILQHRPELLSPNVVLRPLCQDTLLPTVAYVAGPSEIAYFAQLKPLYEEFGIPMPIIYPRSSVTILEEKVEKVLTRFAIDVTEFFRDKELIKQRVAEDVSDVKVDPLFESTVGTIDEALSAMREGLIAIDQTLLGALENVRRRIHGNMEVLKLKAIAAQERRHEISLRQVDKAALFLAPNGNFQERELNILYFLNKYGLEFLRWLYGEVAIDKFKHQVIRL